MLSCGEVEVISHARCKQCKASTMPGMSQRLRGVPKLVNLETLCGRVW